MWFHRNIKIFRPISGAKRAKNPVLKLVREKSFRSKRGSDGNNDQHKRRSSIGAIRHKRSSTDSKTREMSQSNLVESEYIRDEIEVTLDKV